MTEQCLAKLREGLSSRTMLNVVCEFNREILHRTINHYASPSLVQEFLTTPYLDLSRPYSEMMILAGLRKLSDINERFSLNILGQELLLIIVNKILCENAQFMLHHREFAQDILRNTEVSPDESEIARWVSQVRTLFNQAEVGSIPNISNDDQPTVLNYEPSISRMPECIVSAIISSKKTCPCCFDELTISTTIIMTSCCWDCYCIDCVRQLHAPICPSCRTPFDFHVAQM